MKTKKDFSDAISKNYRTELKSCPHCDSSLKRSHIAWKKYIHRLDGLYRVTNYGHKCSNPECNYRDVTYKSAEADMLSPKGRTFGLDIIADIGHQRFKENHSIPKIHKDLRRREIDISEREVYELVEVYLQLLDCGKELDASIYESVEENGGIVLAIDGVQPERGNETLYVLIDMISETVILAENLLSSARDEIGKLLQKVKDKRLPVLAVVSDHQSSIRKAVAKFFPGTPHQFCHFHLMGNAAKPITELDRAMKKEIRMKIRGIRPIERSVAELEKQERVEAAVVSGKPELPKSLYLKNLCLMTRHLLVLSSKYPLKPGGIVVYERLKTVNEHLKKRMLTDPDPLIAKLEKLTRVWALFKDRHERIKRLYYYVWKLKDILGNPLKAREVKASMNRFLKELETDFDKSEDELFQFCLWNMHYHIVTQWKGLFYCFDDPRIPNTNNRLEALIGDMKQHFRMIAGRLTWAKYMVRFGPELAFAVSYEPGNDYEELIKKVPNEDFQEHWDKFLERKERFSMEHRIAHDFEGALKELERIYW